MISLLKRIFGKPSESRLRPESDYIIEITEKTVSCLRPDGTKESVDIDDISIIDVQTNSLGPFAPDVFYILHGSSKGCVIPMGATNESKLLDIFFKLPGFDSQKFIEGMSSTSDRMFRVWERQTEQGAAANL